MDIISKLLGEWSSTINAWSCLFKIALCMVFAAIAGAERTTKLHSAGIKTFIFVSMAASLAAICDMYLIQTYNLNISILSAAIIIAIAIISTNTILFSSKNQLRGLTTSVGLWGVGVISLVIGFGQYFLGLVAFVLLMSVMIFLPRYEKKMKQKSAYIEVHIELKSKEGLQIFINSLRKLGIKINDIEANIAYANSGLAVYSMSIKVSNTELKNKSHAEIIDAIKGMETVAYAEEIY